MFSPPSAFTVSDYWDAIKSGAKTHVRFNFFNQSIKLTDEDIDISYGVVLEDILNGDTDVTIGKAVMKKLSARIILSSKTENLDWTDQFIFQFGMDLNGTTKWVQLDMFYGEKPNNITTVNVVDFVAYDAMIKFNKPADGFFDTVSFPTNLDGIMEKLSLFVLGTDQWAGFKPEDTIPTNIFYNKSFSAAPFDDTGYTCRDILAMIAEACGRYARIEYQRIILCFFRDNTSYVISADEEFSIENEDILSDNMTWDEFDQYTWNEADQFVWNDIDDYYFHYYGVQSVKIKQENLGFDVDYPQESDRNVYTIIDNPFLTLSNVTQDVEDYVKPLYDILYDFGSYPQTRITCVGSWLVESGDIISVQIGNKIVPMPVFVHTLRWNGVVTDEIEVTWTKERVTVSSENKQKILEKKRIQLYTEDEYYKIRSGIDIEPEGVSIYGGKYIKIESDGVFDVDTTNFKISSTDKRMTSGKWTFDDKGLEYDNGVDPLPFQIARYADRKYLASGLFTEYDSGAGRLVLLAECANNVHTSASGYWRGEVVAEIRDVEDESDGYGGYISGLKTILYPRATHGELGTSDHVWFQIYTNTIHGSDGTDSAGYLVLAPHPDMSQVMHNIFLKAEETNNQKIIKLSRGPETDVLEIFGNVTGYLKGAGTAYVGSSSSHFAYGYIDKVHGAIACDYSSITNFNNLTTDGHYWVNLSSMTNNPSGLTSGACEVEVVSIGSTYIIQRIYIGGFIYMRTRTSGTWGSWYKFTGTAV